MYTWIDQVPQQTRYEFGKLGIPLQRFHISCPSGAYNIRQPIYGLNGDIVAYLEVLFSLGRDVRVLNRTITSAHGTIWNVPEVLVVVRRPGEDTKSINRVLKMLVDMEEASAALLIVRKFLYNLIQAQGDLITIEYVDDRLEDLAQAALANVIDLVEHDVDIAFDPLCDPRRYVTELLDMLALYDLPYRTQCRSHWLIGVATIARWARSQLPIRVEA